MRVLDRPYPILVLTTLIWAGNAVASRLAVGEISPMALVTLRWGVVILVLAIVARPALARDRAEIVAHWPYVLAMGFSGFTAFNALFYLAAHHTTAVNISIIQGSIPVLVFIGAFIAFRTRVRLLQIVGAVVTIMGVVTVATQGDLARLAAFAFNLGDLWMAIGCLFYAAYTVALRNRPAAISGLGFLAACSLGAFLTSLPLLAIEIAQGGFMWPTPKGLLVILYVALLPSLVAQFLFLRAVELIGAGRAGLFINLVPVFGPILAVMILAEPFGVYHAVALALVLGGILLAEWTARRGLPRP